MECMDHAKKLLSASVITVVIAIIVEALLHTYCSVFIGENESFKEGGSVYVSVPGSEYYRVACESE